MFYSLFCNNYLLKNAVAYYFLLDFCCQIIIFSLTFLFFSTLERCFNFFLATQIFSGNREFIIFSQDNKLLRSLINRVNSPPRKLI